MTLAVTPRDLGFDPSDPAFIADPYPVYRRLRDEHPVLWNPETGQWLLSRHADVNRLLRDRRLGRTYLHQATHAEMGRPEPPAWHAPFHELNDAGMLDLEPPDHTRIRRLVLKAFTPRTVEAMRTRIQAVVDGLIDGFDGAGEVDLIADFAEPLPVTVIAELLGIPEADRHHLRPWSADICLMYELNPSDDSARRAVRASVEFGAYLRDLLAERRARPGDDLISALAAVVDDGDTLTETELVATCVLLLNAGHEASVNGAGNGWWTLFRHPDALARLRADPGLLPTRHRGAPALRHAAVAVRALGPRADRDRRSRDPAGWRGRAAVRVGQPRPGGVPRPGRRWTSRATRTRTCRSGRASTTASARRWPSWSSAIAFGTLLRRVPRLELVETPRWKPTFVLRGLEALRVRV